MNDDGELELEQRDAEVTSAVDGAIRDAGGGLVASWVLIAEVVAEDGTREPRVWCSPQPSWVESFGLLEVGRRIIGAEFASADDAEA